MAKKSINILDKDYTRWVKELSTRYRKSQKMHPRSGNKRKIFQLLNKLLSKLPMTSFLFHGDITVF
ncbi:hypothetical protein SAMN05720472_0435 [Fibrobacter sp. UWR3]|uniref:hypothetical protein n=1 Tax=Fibrobacter sp. UWR3 TaxID=1896217 RepID=UPI0009178CBA|nr:hypothetical protein [Fibrobacter sp. UWR3]SHN10737.1 hypothetical protein SAMN05720472_0435 [Fibrobacter sp. UWR3]